MVIFFISGLEISEDLIKGFRLFYIKEKHNLTEAAFNDILREMDLSGVTLYRLRKVLGQLVPLEPILIDCCIDSCIAFTKEYETLESCPICEKTRYKAGTRTARKQAAYWSPISSLQMQYRDRKNAETLRYRKNYIESSQYVAGDRMADVFDGTHYKSLVDSGLFLDSRDVALMGSTDGYQIFRQKRNDCWIVLLINANLPPSERVKKDNLMISAMFPGPKQPKNMNSFLWPLVEELKKLEGNVI
jgi:hypothetical protein